MVLAALVRSERRHGWARRTLAEIIAGRYGPGYVTDYIVDEALSYAAARLGEEASRRLLRLLVEEGVFRILPVGIDIFAKAVETYRRHLPRLSFTDATSLEAARAYRIDYIATLDGYLASLYPSIHPGR